MSSNAFARLMNDALDTVARRFGALLQRCGDACQLIVDCA
jgi:hypothetical protein